MTLPPPSPQPVVEVAQLPILRLFDVPEEQSPTLLIKGVLGELAPEEQATKTQGNIEEDGSSSNLRKEDDEDNNAVTTGQIVNAPSKQVEIPKVEPERKDSIAVEERAPKRCLVEEVVPKTEDEIQVVYPLVPGQQSLAS